MRSEGGVSGPLVSIAILPSGSDTAMTKVHSGQGSDLARRKVPRCESAGAGRQLNEDEDVMSFTSGSY